MAREPQTLWEQEQIDKKQQKRREEIQAIIGSRVIPTGYIDAPLLRTLGHDPATILVKGGYTKLPNNSYCFYFMENGSKYRFHAYILPNKNIQIHTDKIVRGGSPRPLHIPSRYKVSEERKRLRFFFPYQSLSKKQLIKKERKDRYGQVLSIEKTREVLQKIRDNLL